MTIDHESLARSLTLLKRLGRPPITRTASAGVLRSLAAAGAACQARIQRRCWQKTPSGRASAAVSFSLILRYTVSAGLPGPERGGSQTVNR
jgi:hypothetical protein